MQTDRHTDALIAILCTPTSGQSNMLQQISEHIKLV